MYRPLLAAFALLLCFAPALRAQEGSQEALDFLQSRYPKLGLTATDVAELEVLDNYPSPSGVRHVILGQRHRGIPVFNAQAALHLRAGKVSYYTDRLVRRLAERAVAATPLLTAAAALRIQWPAGAAELLEAELVYFPREESPEIPLAWRLVADDPTDGKTWLAVVDATSGRELLRSSLTLTCDFSTPHGAGGAAGARSAHKRGALDLLSVDGAFYNVFPFGIESPIYGDRELLFEPADSLASPYGWHDTNGEPGPEYTITRGNNVYAYRDADDNANRPDSGFVADGGPELDFDFPFAPEQGPDSLVRASLTQLFYTNNMVHDWAYRHGFDEAAGNFQTNNYDRGGRGRDELNAEAQDESGINNANMTTFGDGRSPRMQMYLWSASSVLRVVEPAALAGERLTGPARFGPVIGAQPLSGRVVVGRDGTADPRLGCATLVNPEEVAGNIAMLTRGSCFFQQKAFNAERAGAIAVIICNPENNIIPMGAVTEPNNIPVTIPTLMLREADCIPLRQVIAAGDTVSVVLQNNSTVEIDGSFDNGVVTHEYAHGISNRLVGGPGNAFCLGNNEQMGEGWSDFFTLASTPRSEVDRPTGRERRGIGNYITSATPDGKGIRSQFYSTDRSINDLVYDDIITIPSNLPHPLGEIWAATLWDLYWAMVDEYGFDDDLLTGTGGNNAAVRLVIEGMKYTPCNPGMIDGRDGILVADQFENEGANQCLIWKVFAARGMGLSADQGSSNSRSDNRQDFDLTPECIPTVKLAKRANETSVDAGEEVTYTLTVRNDKDQPVTGVTVTDFIPEGMQLVAGSVRGTDAFSVLADRINFSLPAIDPEDRTTIVYTVSTDPDLGTTGSFFAGAEEENEAVWEVLSNQGSQFWERTDSLVYAGERAWFVADPDAPSDQTLQFIDPVLIDGERPALRFFTRYETEAGFDAGIVQVSTDGQNWENIDGKFLRYDYRGFVTADGSEPIRGTPTFWGDSEGYHDVIVDMSEYRGREVYVRWRFVADANTGGPGWWIDNVEIVDQLFNYDGEAVLTTAEGDEVRTSAEDLGVVVNTGDFLNPVVDPALGQTLVTAYPNPASDRLTVSIRADRSGPATIVLLSVDGRQLARTTFAVRGGINSIDLPLHNVPAGMYLLRVSGRQSIATLKITVAR